MKYIFEKMGEHGLSKVEKLCSRTAIDRLFAEGEAFIAYPLRIVYRIEEAEDTLPKFFISIPKRNFKRAVKRVYLRRRVREAYRLHKEILVAPLLAQKQTAHIAFLYLDKKLSDYHLIEEKMIEALNRLVKKIKPQSPAT